MPGRVVRYFCGGNRITVKSTDMWCGGAAGSRRGCALMLLLVLCIALAHALYDKRAEMSPVPFVMGSRYGRSPARPLSPRNDRFFLGSRYGKRAVMTSLHAPPDEPLECEYTGVYPLYRCVRAPPLPPAPSLNHRPLQISRYHDDSTEADRGDGE